MISNLKTSLNLLCLLFLSFSLNAQSVDRIELQREIWGNTEPQYTNLSIPEKWQNESAVILLKDVHHKFKPVRSGRPNQIFSETTYHTKIALLDKNAVKKYSEFSFVDNAKGIINYRKNKDGITIAMRVIKSSGESKIINLDRAVVIESDKKTAAKKIAIPNLQKGDIIDFFYRYNEEINTSQYSSFGSYVANLEDEYPVKFVRYRFNLVKGYKLSYIPLNGAPDLQLKEKTDKSELYEVVLENVEKQKDIDMSFTYRHSPTIKYQFLGNENSYYIPENCAHPEYSNIKVKMGRRERDRLSYPVYQRFDFGPKMAQEFFLHLKKAGKVYEEMSDIEIIEEFYRLQHFNFIEKRIEASITGGEEYPLPVSDVATAIYLRNGYEALGIEGEVLMSTPRSYGEFENLLMYDEVSFVIRLFTESKGAVYLPNFSLHPEIDRIPIELEGQRGLLFPLSNIRYQKYTRRRMAVIGIDTVLETSPGYKNLSVTESEISFSEDMSKVLFNNKSQYSGHNKTYYQNNLLSFYDYWEEDAAYFNYEEELSEKEKLKKKQIRKEYKEQSDQGTLDAAQEILNRKYNAEDVKVAEFEVANSGRLGSESPDFIFTVKGETDNLIQSAGPNYLLNAGMLIGAQREIQAEDKKREVDIFLSCAQSFQNTVKVKIPEGYMVEGFEKLNVEVNNKTGGFIGSAVLEGGNLLITTEKWYSKNFQPVENWSLMLEFLEAAYNFTEVKVLLKKI